MHRLYIGGSLDLPGPLHPNGIALDRDGTFVVAHLGENDGGVYRLTREGQLSPVLQRLDGEDLPAVNFVLLDHQGRLWVTISTRQRPRMKAFSRDVKDGYIVLVDRRGPHVVADGFGFTNEVRVDQAGRTLHVVETYARKLTRFAVADDGTLSQRQTILEFGSGEFPDGLALDAEGGVWVTCLVSNRLVRVMSDGSRQTMLEDNDEDYTAEVEQAYQTGRMQKTHIDQVHSRKLANISSLAFAGSDLKTVYLGVLLGDRLPTFQSPIAGQPMAHWNWR
ncbi:MAG: SMP-30/gluconolactonase/LRE family protein [Pseudorhodoplanes sp.]|nr:SMP-30/gluconolactonase/LRE family protein [Pseudorhodoplanes sp.]